MNRKGLLVLHAVATLFAAIGVQGNDAEPRRDEVVPLIVIGDVPLSDAIRNIARQMNLNFILDPCVPGSGPGAGRGVREPDVNIRLEKKTVDYALNLVLKKHGLTMITNPVTTVARIVPIGHRIKPVLPIEFGSDTNGAIPIVALEGVSLVHAIDSLTKVLNLKVIFDPAILKSEYGREDTEIMIRWTNVTARQALAALLDNYDLAITQQANKGYVEIVLKTGEEADLHRKLQRKKKRALSFF